MYLRVPSRGLNQKSPLGFTPKIIFCQSCKMRLRQLTASNKPHPSLGVHNSYQATAHEKQVQRKKKVLLKIYVTSPMVFPLEFSVK